MKFISELFFGRAVSRGARFRLYLRNCAWFIIALCLVRLLAKYLTLDVSIWWQSGTAALLVLCAVFLVLIYATAWRVKEIFSFLAAYIFFVLVAIYSIQGESLAVMALLTLVGWLGLVRCDDERRHSQGNQALVHS